MINQNWNRWIFASLAVYFKDSISDDIVVVIEGQQKQEEGDHVEFRMNGPDWLRESKTTCRGDVVVNLLVHCVPDASDYHKIYRMVGVVEAAVGMCIPIKKYGNQQDDDENVIIGQLILQRNGDKDIDTTHYGQYAPDVPVIESTVEALYRSTDLMINNL